MAYGKTTKIRGAPPRTIIVFEYTGIAIAVPPVLRLTRPKARILAQCIRRLSPSAAMRVHFQPFDVGDQWKSSPILTVVILLMAEEIKLKGFHP